MELESVMIEVCWFARSTLAKPLPTMPSTIAIDTASAPLPGSSRTITFCDVVLVVGRPWSAFTSGHRTSYRATAGGSGLSAP